MKNKTRQLGLSIALFCVLPVLGLASCGKGQKNPHEEENLRQDSVIVPRLSARQLLGRGFNSVRSEKLDHCMTLESIDTIEENKQNTLFSMKQIENVQDLGNAISESKSEIFGFGIYHGSAKADYIGSQNFNSNSSYLHVSVRVEYRTDLLTAYKFSETALKLLMANKKSEFLSQCGDKFISASDIGGEFAAIVEFESETGSQKEQISKIIKDASGSWTDASHFISSMEKLSEIKSAKVTVLHTAQADGPLNFNDLKEMALKFPQTITLENSRPYSLSTISYDALLTDHPELPQPTNLRHAQRFFEIASKRYMSLIMSRNDITFAIEKKNQFEFFDTEKLLQIQGKISAEIESLKNSSNLCFTAPESDENCTFPSISSPQFPALKRF